MKIGDTATLVRRFLPFEIEEYAALTGADIKPGIIPEPMIGTIFSFLLGVKLPGPGANYLKQTLNFHGVAKLGTTLIATVRVTALRPEKQLVDLETLCRDEDGRLVCSGRALVRVPVPTS